MASFSFLRLSYLSEDVAIRSSEPHDAALSGGWRFGQDIKALSIIKPENKQKATLLQGVAITIFLFEAVLSSV